MLSLTRFQYGLSSIVRPWFPHQTTSPLLMTNFARPALTSLTISRATHSPPCSRKLFVEMFGLVMPEKVAEDVVAKYVKMTFDPDTKELVQVRHAVRDQDRGHDF
jgi:hypothetical protein